MDLSKPLLSSTTRDVNTSMSVPAGTQVPPGQGWTTPPRAGGPAWPPAGAPKGKRPIHKRWWVWALGVIAVIIVISSASGGGGKSATTGSPAAVATSDPAAPTPRAAAAPVAPPAPNAAATTGGKNPADDVVVTSCATDDAGYAGAKIRITNNSSKASNYLVTVTFESPDGATQVGTGIASVNSLQPGQATDEDVNAFKQPTSPYICKVNAADVTRYAA